MKEQWHLVLVCIGPGFAYILKHLQEMHPLPRSWPSLVLFLTLSFFLVPFPPPASSSSSSSSLATTPFCHPDEAIALLQFKHSFSFDPAVLTQSRAPLTISTTAKECAVINAGRRRDRYISFLNFKTKSWKEGTNCCKWQGVSCDNITGHIIGLDLSCSQLYGSFPPNSTLFSLPHLRSLKLASNHFSNSEIPRELSRLTALNHLDLSWSSFYGDVPSEISRLSNLVYLDLSHNYQLEMESDAFRALAQNLSRITELVLDGVNMSSTEVGLFANLSSTLASLSASACSLEGRLPEGMFSRLLQLESIDLSGNDQLTGKLPDSVGQYSKSLHRLFLYSCSFRGPIPKSLGNLSQLINLDLHNNFLTNDIPNFLGTKLKFITLGENKLQGSIPSSIFKQKDLYEIDLSPNNLSGLVDMYRFSKLQNLYFLDLGHNMFTINISGSVTFPNLSSLSLGDNTLTSNTSGSIAFPSLETLHMPSVGITEFPTFLKRTNNLHTLDLSNNKIRRIPQWMYDVSKDSLITLNLSYNFIKVLDRLPWKNIMVLDINSNSLQGVLPPLPSRLQLLSLSNNSLFGEIPSSICKATYLEILDLSHNMFNATIPGCLSSSLLSLSLSNNSFFGEIPSSICNATSLAVLDLSHNMFNVTIPGCLSSSLQWLSLSNNSLIGEIPSSICNATSLAFLDLSDNMFNATIPGCLFNCGNWLSVLNLGRNNLRGITPTTFAKGCQLEFLGLNENLLEGALPTSISHCKGLQVLNLAANLLNDSIPSWVEALPKLQVLILRSNKFHGWLRTFHKHKHPFQKLQILDLSNNQLSGPIPKDYIKNLKSIMYPDQTVGSSSMYMGSQAYGYEFSISLTIKGTDVAFEKILTTLASIDLSDNKFSGEIPENTGMLEALKGLNLSHNKLSGQIPPSLANLKNLEWLDLSSYKLTGQIPMELTDLTFLSTLNLSSNKFTGRIPQGEQFNTFPNGSYAGNKGLCGFPLTKQCSNSKGEAPQPFAVAVQQPADDFVHQSVIEWKAVLMGYPCGVSFGISLACFVFKNGNPKWFLELVRFVRIKSHV